MSIWQRIKSVGTIGAWLFVIAHIFIWGGAVAYVSHLAGFEVPFLDHKHGCDCSALEPMPESTVEKIEDEAKRLLDDIERKLGKE